MLQTTSVFFACLATAKAGVPVDTPAMLDADQVQHFFADLLATFFAAAPFAGTAFFPAGFPAAFLNGTNFFDAAIPIRSIHLTTLNLFDLLPSFDSE